MTSPLGRYRIMAWIVGVGLLVLTLVAMPLKYLAGNPAAVEVVGPVHGFLFVLYLFATLDLAVRRHWAIVKTFGVMIAGTIPFLSFIVEHRITGQERIAAEPVASAIG
jgi:integral membrane protein